MKWVYLGVVGLLTAFSCGGCSVAALVEQHDMETRMQALEARVHMLETGQPAVASVVPK